MAVLLAVLVIAIATGSLQIAESSSPSSSLPSLTHGPTSVPTPEAREKKQNPVRRFFSWFSRVATRPFRRRAPRIEDPPIVSVTASPSSLMPCRSFASTQPCSPESEVELNATAESPEGDSLVFTWAVTGGRLKGEGRKVTWDLSGLGEGFYTATVDVNYAKYRRSVSTSTVVRIFPCAICDPPPCPSVAVSCPSAVEHKQPIVFEATVSGGDSELKTTYTWSVTAGKIISGQGTSKITVDASKLVGQSITATVTVGGYNPMCPGTTAVCTVLEVRP